MEYTLVNLETLTNEVEQLLDLDMFVSADRLLSLVISAFQKYEQQNPNIDEDQWAQSFIKIFEMAGDSAFRKGEYRRAQNYFRLSEQRKRSSQSFGNRNHGVLSCAHGARLKYKECSCMVKLDQKSDALHQLEAIPTEFRDPKINLLLGKLYKYANQKKAAISSYMHVLAVVPNSLEVIEVLVQLGVRATEIQKVISSSLQTTGKFGKGENWVHDLISGLCAKYNCRHDQSLSYFRKLNIKFPKACFILTYLATISLNVGETEASYSYYRQVRNIDPFLIEDMDVLGKVLYTRRSHSELNKLASDVLDVDPRSSRGWLLAAMYCDMKGDDMKANIFLDKAIQLEPMHAECYRVKGTLCLKQGNFQVALIAFSQANSLEKNLSSFSGVVQASISLGKLKDAVLAAKECVHIFPLCSTAHLLLGQTLSKAAQESALGESICCFQKAQHLSPKDKAVTVCLVEALSRQKRYAEAIYSLKLSLNSSNDHQLRYLLGKIYANVGNYPDAIQNLHLSISINSGDNSDATQELSRIEQLIKNKNIDAVCDGNYGRDIADTGHDMSEEHEDPAHFLSDDRS